MTNLASMDMICTRGVRVVTCYTWTTDAVDVSNLANLCMFADNVADLAIMCTTWFM